MGFNIYHFKCIQNPTQMLVYTIHAFFPGEKKVSFFTAHVKTSLMGASLTVPITNGKLNLGTWQGVWLCEHRDHASSRKIVVTLQGTQK